MCDVMGQRKDRWPKQKPAFRAAPPHSGMRYETNRMVILPEAKNRMANKFYSIYDKNGKVRQSMIKRISWKEERKK
jgi:hypothetical protein